MAAAAPTKAADRKLQLKEILDWLVEDGQLDRATASKLLAEARTRSGGNRHPIVVINDARLKSAKPPHVVLNAQTLTEWLATRLKMPHYFIDPVKVYLKAVTQVQSGDYEQKP